MAVRDFKLDADGDLAVEAGDLVLLSDLEALKQSVQIRLQFFLGEWYLNQAVGIPYYQSVLVKNPNPAVLDSTFRQALLDTPGILDVSSLVIEVDAATRTGTVTFRASSDLGEFDMSVAI